jgi:selenocysteine-specific elongation factor
VSRSALEGVARADAGEELVAALSAAGRIVEVAGRWYGTREVDALAETVDDLTSEFLARNPLKWGIDKEELRQRCSFPHGPQVFNAMLEEVGRRRPVFVRGNRVRSGGEELTLDRGVEAELATLAEVVRGKGVAFPSIGEVERAWSGRERFQDALQVLKDRGDVVAVGTDGVLHREASSDRVSVGDVKGALGLSRKHTIPILEHFDDAGLTRRSGNDRLVGPAFPN